MSTYDDARDLVIDRLENIIAEATTESHEDVTSEPYEDGSEESVRDLHVQSIVYRLMDQV